MVELPAKAADDVRVGLAQGMAGTRVDVVGADARQRRRCLDARRRQPHRLQRHRVLDLSERHLQVSRQRRHRRAQLRGRRLLVLEAPPPRCLRRRLLTPASLCSPCSSPPSPALAGDSTQPSAAVSDRGEPATHAPEILARGPWALEQITVRWHDQPFEPSPEQTEAANAAIRELRERGSPSHDGMAARAPGRLPPGRGGPGAQAAAAALGAATHRRRRLPERGRAVRDPLRRRPLAGRAPGPMGLLVGRTLGARGGRRGRPRREPRRNAGPGVEGGVGCLARARARRGAAATAAPACHVRRPGLARRGRRGGRQAGPRARTRSSRGGLARSTSGRPRPEGTPCPGWPDGCRSEHLPAPGGRTAQVHAPEVDLVPTHSCVYTALLVSAFAAGKPEPLTLVLGWTHGLLWIFMSLACITAARLRVVSLKLAVAVAVLGGIGCSSAATSSSASSASARRAHGPR